MSAGKTVFERGDVIADRYRVRRALGRGGMGAVYLVDDLTENRRLALKTLLPEYAGHRIAIRRFVREVNAVRRLNHPGIVKIYDAQRTESLLFYTMDYIEGKSLRSWMQQRGRLGLGSTVRILALLADALKYAHQYTIHRDISPENVMVLSDGSIRLLDFGLAKLSDNQGAFTRIGISLGKEQYNSPEQRASAADVDCRTDIYSLGVMFYEMLSGDLPDPEIKLTNLVLGLPREADAFVEKAMATLPEQRYANAHEFRKALMYVYNVASGKIKPAPARPAQPAPPPTVAVPKRGLLSWPRRFWARLRGRATAPTRPPAASKR